MQPAGLYLLGRGNDRPCPRLVQQPEFAVAARRGQLDGSQRRNKVRIDGDRGAGDRKILHGTQGVDAIIGGRGYIPVAQKIVFASHTHQNLSQGLLLETAIRSGSSAFSKPNTYSGFRSYGITR